MESNNETYLGFDLSTQKLKAVLLNFKLDNIAHAEVMFDSDLPEFRTVGGVNAGRTKNDNVDKGRRYGSGSYYNARS
ncbi:uncharacterized protein LOC125953354 isoform X4 [Anopheles darlingi]|uniref:uncharacterized protein LOC125953354 isoform X4 n=1 Tax=Anopheles darlingi TaxID=43151 RepID=UPI0020FFFC80|nr:uncharacterized protein LOC125953354 isoform X4 [Anopheles darlingi]